MLFLVAAAFAEDPVPAAAEPHWTLGSFELPKIAKPLIVGKAWQARITIVVRKDGAGKSSTWRLPDSATSSSLGLNFVVTGLPRGATFDPETRLFTFTPRQGDLGHNRVQVTLTYAGGRSTQTLDLTVGDKSMTWLMPGAGYTFYAPSNAPMFHGASIEYLVNRFVQTQQHGPGHGRFYVRLDLLTPLEGGGDPLLLYSLGVGLSLERNPGRPWFIPNFGLEVGGLSRQGVGTAFVLSPSASLHLYSSRAVTLGVDGSWMVPIAFERFDDWTGFRGRAFLDLALW